MKSETKSVGIWIRVSTEDQARGESPEHHEKRARMYAEVKGWDVVEVYHLEGVSGKSVIEHPEAKRMMADVKAGRITGLIFSKLARLARSTKQLLEFADYFQVHHADLISLQEAIDTSTPAGRLFYTIIAAMAQWEREEIADRVKASIPVRARMGKSLGGKAPYGYKWVDQQLKLDPEEAPIRKWMFELFLEHRKKKTVARLINEKGIRTRGGAKFTAWTISRLLKDPIAKGLRRSNYTKSLGKDKHWEYKPEEEWIFTPAPAVVSEDTWNEVNAILAEQNKKNARPRRGVTHLFSGFIYCHCGCKMYVLTNTQKYVCNDCRNKIRKDDMEDIWQEQLKAYTVSDIDIQQNLTLADQSILDRETVLETLRKKAQDLSHQLETMIQLVNSGEIPKTGFNKHYQPVFDQLQQLETEIPALEAEIDFLKVQRSSSDHILREARDLYSRWSLLAFEEKRKIVETILSRIEVSERDIEINLNFLAPAPELMTRSSHNPAPAATTTTPSASASAIPPSSSAT